MAMKIVLVSLMIFVLAASQAEAQTLSGVVAMESIDGTLYCTPDGNINLNAATPTPPFPNAQVQASCNGTLISQAFTNGNGEFKFAFNPFIILERSILPSCKVVVNTPLLKCNVSLPLNGVLQALLETAESTLIAGLNVTNFATLPFTLLGINI